MVQVKLFSGNQEIRNNGRDASPGERIIVQVAVAHEVGLKDIDIDIHGHTVDGEMKVSHQFPGWEKRQPNKGNGVYALLRARLCRGILLIIEFPIFWMGENGDQVNFAKVIRAKVTPPQPGRTPRIITDLPEEVAPGAPAPAVMSPAGDAFVGAPDADPVL